MTYKCRAGKPGAWTIFCLLLGTLLGLSISGCGGHDDISPSAQQSAFLTCDDSMKTAFKPDANTTVVFVKQFKAGSSYELANTPASPTPPVAATDVCLVKLVVGPGNPGPAGAPSTSAGIGIEVWLPTASVWNNIIRATGSGGWAGGAVSDPTQVATKSLYLAAVNKGYVVSASDHGHVILNNGSFAMNPDGTINAVLWQDFAERSMHEMAVKTKALVKAYYGRAQTYAYWDGFSTGGRQGFKIAQKYPRDFDGILAGSPAFNWSKFITAELYPQIAMQQSLGAPISAAKLAFVSGAAVKSCDAIGLGYLLNPMQCRYDPDRDVNVLCAGAAGNGVTGASTNSACLTATEAHVVNQIWYGQTTDGSVPDPAVDNGNAATLAANQLWYGLTRGTSLSLSLAGVTPFSIATDQVALELQNPAYAQATFVNATGNGANKWKQVGYSDLTNAYAQGIALQPSFSNINTDDPDLGAFHAAGGKILTYHGLADDKIFPEGSINYFERVATQMGGKAPVQSFYRLFLIPGLAHDSGFATSASIDPTTNAQINAAKMPLPQPAAGRDEMFQALRNWVEKGQAPSEIQVSSADGTASRALCLYPETVHYVGGPISFPASYACQ
ncbi:tannase/feruloyl esterase family alpha/beta hydrolase [Paraburkholderia sp. BL9I2N2]|uniref:tannase/feruloyl esterase family alpha/beta hydrolase n=1 Tax=Paraburkholderia sp. BL9I2N2 TaxID=1938809 RepID=UPI0010479BF2|nr:tannase/feruloyl esterase family alpha/beta hydrolase [Paraburkholderia sp. BL9I2N2]TCK84135.1 feruloyl esterase [Paraburkholderia sp. BL9I2N2]